MKNLIIGRNCSNKAKLASYFLSGKNYSEMIVQVPEILLLMIIDDFPWKIGAEKSLRQPEKTCG